MSEATQHEVTQFTAERIAEITGGTLAPGTDPATLVDSVVTDSRDVSAGSLFVAKPGEAMDGHDFVPAALDAGATLILGEREVTLADGSTAPAVFVPDAVLAMGALAADRVRRLREANGTKVLGVTGSAGKTTTKDLLIALMSTQGPTVGPIGSYNGEVGVPLTVLGAGPDTKFLVIEMGATKVGNIEYLTDMVGPDVGAVLMVGSAHLGEFGSVENIVRTKGELVEGLPSDGVAVLNYDDERVRSMAERTPARVLWFSVGDDDAPAGAVRASGVSTDVDGHPRFSLELPGSDPVQVESKLIGVHHVANLLAAAAVASACDVPPGTIAQVLSTTAAASRHRMERTDRDDGITIINDAYNANPDSMRAALRTLATLGADSGRRTWAVLGGMLELGETSIAEHDAIGRAAVRLNINRLVVVGDTARSMHTGAVMEGSWGEESAWMPDLDAARELLEAKLQPGDIVLFKSSRDSNLRELGDQIKLAPMKSAQTGSTADAGQAGAP